MLIGTVEERLTTCTGAKPVSYTATYEADGNGTVTVDYNMRDLQITTADIMLGKEQKMKASTPYHKFYEPITYVHYEPDIFMKSYKCRHLFLPEIEKVIFNDPATIIIWSDGKKTIVKVHDEPYDKEKGFSMCVLKRLYGDEYHKLLKEVLKDG